MDDSFDPARFRERLIALRDSQTTPAEGRVEVDFRALCDVLHQGHAGLIELGAAEAKLQRIQDIDYWDGNGGDLLDWVSVGYVEHGDGSRETNPRFETLPA